jgi:hypothetical protein
MKMKAKLDSNQEEIKASKEQIIAELKVWHDEIKACQEPREAKIIIGLEVVQAMGMEASPVEVEVVAKLQKVPNEEAAVETIKALKTNPEMGVWP